MNSALLARLQQARAAKRAVALVTHLSDGRQALVEAKALDGDPLPPPVLDTARQYLDQDRSGSVEANDGRWFVHSYQPPLRMLIIGAVHITQALAPMATTAGYEVHVIDPREVFASDARFPTVSLSDQWPDVALQRLQPDRRTAVVTLTHDPKLDDPALQLALASAAFYIGALGSRKTHASRCERLQAAGLDDEQIARIHAPVGLAIGAKSPAEIAVSILAQVTQVLRAMPS